MTRPTGQPAPPDRDTICERYIDSLEFDPYPFQEEAILAWFETDAGLLVTAPTGMGKTLVAETAVFEALHTGRPLYYTTPLIALTDQKLVDLQDKAEAWGFSRDDVGLLTGNRKVNPEAPVLVVVAEILLNHLLSPEHSFDGVTAVVMDEFHSFNDRERGVVWELSLVLLPKHVRLLLISATVGNAVDFVSWLDKQHGKNLRLVRTDERKVPLEFTWIEDKLLTEQLVDMLGEDDESSRTPALVFCFARDECWEMAERLKGLPLVDKAAKAAVEAELEGEDLTKSIGPKLRQMLIRGVGVHHAGILPRHKALVERLFTAKLIPFVVCTETLAAGINLPARSVVLRTLLKGKPREKKVLPSSAAHQMFGRAGRPQFDSKGYVYALAHEDDVKLLRWKARYDQIPATTKDPSLLRARKQLERKRPRRRSTEQYWSEGQFSQLIDAGPARLASRSMIPYRFLAWLLTHGEGIAELRAFLGKRLNSAERVAGFERELDAMLGNLQALGYLAREEGGDAITLDDSIHELLGFRGVDPLYGAWLSRRLAPASLQEKIMALESVLDLPWRVIKAADIPFDLMPGPLQTNDLEPLMISMGVLVTRPEKTQDDLDRERLHGRDPDEEVPPTFPEMLKIAFEAQLTTPEDMQVQTMWVAGGVLDSESDFYRFIGSRNLGKNEGIVLRHLLRLVTLTGEFHAKTEDPDYELIAARATEACERVEPVYTRHFLESAGRTEDLLPS